MAAVGGKSLWIDPADHVAAAISRFRRFLHEELALSVRSLGQVRFAQTPVDHGQVLPALDMRMYGDAIEQQLPSFC